VLLDIGNISIAVGILLLSRIQAEIYVIFHIHFQLQAAIFDILLNLTYESVRTSPTVLLDLKNGGFLWKFADISIVS